MKKAENTHAKSNKAVILFPTALLCISVVFVISMLLVDRYNDTIHKETVSW